MASNPYGLTGIASPSSAAGQGLGLGDQLGMQRDQETDEQRKKRLAGQQDPGTSAAVRDLFGGLNPGLGSLGGRGRVGI
jgi:hypothetical protein